MTYSLGSKSTHRCVQFIGNREVTQGPVTAWEFHLLAFQTLRRGKGKIFGTIKNLLLVLPESQEVI